ncbi:MAG: hypothetical protein ACE5PV_24925 [Candidatus Poribacteria bacterium]
MIGVGKVAGQKVFGKVTSPEILKLGPIGVEKFAIGIVLVGYIKPHAGGFPSKYDFYAWF